MEILTPVKAIRAKCIDCCGGSSFEVKECPIKDCSLYHYRLGKNPNRAGKGGNPNIGAFRKKQQLK